MVGGLFILMLFTIASMRKGVLLHKLIIAELILATTHGTFIFPTGSTAGWYTSSTAVLLYISYNLHNVINWIKVKPFLNRWGSWLYIGTVILVWPYWIAEMYFNFEYNNNLGDETFVHTRPWEALCREPWWLFTTGFLIFTIRRSYTYKIKDLVRRSAKFGILLFVMALSLCLIVADIVTVIVVSSPCAGENPFWKVRRSPRPTWSVANKLQIALVLKCTADTIFLDDFKSVLDRLSVRANDEFTGSDKQPEIGDDRGGTMLHCTTCSCHGSIVKEPSFQHLESTSSPQPNAQRHTTREWFDVIDTP